MPAYSMPRLEHYACCLWLIISLIMWRYWPSFQQQPVYYALLTPLLAISLCYSLYTSLIRHEKIRVWAVSALIIGHGGLGLSELQRAGEQQQGPCLPSHRTYTASYLLSSAMSALPMASNTRISNTWISRVLTATVERLNYRFDLHKMTTHQAQPSSCYLNDASQREYRRLQDKLSLLFNASLGYMATCFVSFFLLMYRRFA